MFVVYELFYTECVSIESEKKLFRTTRGATFCVKTQLRVNQNITMSSHLMRSFRFSGNFSTIVY